MARRSLASPRRGGRALAGGEQRRGRRRVCGEAGIAARILVMADFLPAERAALLEYNLTPVIHSLEDIADWNRLATPRGARCLSSEDRQRHGAAWARAPARRNLPRGLRGPGRAAGRADDPLRLRRAITRAARPRNRSLVSRTSARSWRAAGIAPEYMHLSSTIPVAYGRAKPGASWCGRDTRSTAMFRRSRGNAPATHCWT